jgi:hypothetical protein
MIHPGPGTIDEISGIEQCKALKEIDQFKLNIAAGDEVYAHDSTSSEVGHVFMSGDSQEILLEQLKFIEDNLIIKIKT